MVEAWVDASTHTSTTSVVHVLNLVVQALFLLPILWKKGGGSTWKLRALGVSLRRSALPCACRCECEDEVSASGARAASSSTTSSMSTVSAQNSVVELGTPVAPVSVVARARYGDMYTR